jgi:site-specific DNA-cytosine methylase
MGVKPLGVLMRVLIACEFSGIVREAFKKQGHDAWSCDLLPTEIPGNHITGDVLRYLRGFMGCWDLMIAHPPCTHLAVSGAKWFKQKQADGRQQQAIDFFMALVNTNIPHICVENPVSIMSTKYRKPDQIIQPWQFGHGETKTTCLWIKNLPLLKPTNVVSGRLDRIHQEPPSPERWKNRSRTYQGIADAMAEQYTKAIELAWFLTDPKNK